MKKYSKWLAVAVCLLLFVGTWLLTTLFSRQGSTAGESPIVLSEIVAANRTYPAPDGQFLDFIEVHNVSENTVDISGYMLSDDERSIGYTFPAGTVLPPDGYVLCWCNKEANSPDYASFGIAKTGGETIYLYNAIQVLVDSQSVPAMAANEAFARQPDGTWVVSAQATPGFANTQAGYDQWLASMGGLNPTVVISEVMTDNTCIAPYLDWVELTNTGDETITVAGAYLSNDPAEPLKYQLPTLTLEPGQAKVIVCTGDNGATDGAPFGLSKTGCTVVLTGLLGNTVSCVDCPALPADHSFARQSDGSYQVTAFATPGWPNDEMGYAAWMDGIGAGKMEVVISKVMASNRSTILSESGSLCDWVELTNLGTEQAVLNGCFLSDDADDRGKWTLPDLTLAPGGSVVIACVGRGAAAGEAPFALPKSGGKLTLSGPAGNILHQLEYPRLEDDRIYARQEDGTYVQTDASHMTQRPLGAIAISEAMPVNSEYLIQWDGNYYDWVELTNCSDETVDLSDYCLSNDPDNLAQFPLPQRTLKPGQQVVIICSGNPALPGRDIQAPFSLSAGECWLYVTERASGQFSDYLRIHDVPTGCTMGRQEDGGVAYFTTPTPGKPNGDGVESITAQPQLLTPGGIYEDVESVTVTLQGPGQLYYTLDGSVPTAQSTPYTSPIALKQTTVLRAVAVENGKLPSQTATASYIVNEHHTLPVVSIGADPADVTRLQNQIPPADAEVPCAISFFRPDGSFTADCGLHRSGDPALPHQSYSLHFRGRYSGVLGFPLFPGDGGQVFDTLHLRAGRDYDYTLFRSELFETLSAQVDGNLPTRRSQFCVVYINGVYQGIRSLKDGLTPLYYAQLQSVPQDTVAVVEESVPFDTELRRLADYCKASDMTTEEALDHVSQVLDLDRLISWMIIEGYSCNDTGANARYFCSPESGAGWQIASYDFDKAFIYRTGFDSLFQSVGEYAYLPIIRGLMENDVFRQTFLSRLGEALAGPLSEEAVLAVIDDISAQLAPEIGRARADGSPGEANWTADVERLRSMVTQYDHKGMILASLEKNIHLTEQEKAAYFGEVQP